MKNFTELDFLTLKQSLIDYLKDQDEFADFDFDGSGINKIVELLAYNTQYNAFYSNMIANESFLDSAILRESVVSRAKAIGYRPHSKRASKAIIQVNFTPALGGGPPNPTSILVPQWSKFTSTVEDTVYTFMNPKALTVTNNGAGNYIGQLEICEGTLLTHRYIVDSTLDLKQRFILPNAGIDTTTLNVRIQQSASVPTIENYFLATDINVIEGDTKAYFLQETENKLFEVYFGDDIVGKKPVNGNIIIVEYLVTDGPLANGAKKFAPTTTIAGYNGTVYTTVQSSAGGTDEETNESIKFLAPLFYETQNRAVNKHDYETLIRKDYPQVEFARVWGGEENDPPVYGKVYMALKPYDALAFNEQEKLSILNGIIRPRSPVSIEAVIVEPDYLNIIVDTTVKIRSKITTSTLGEIEDNVIDAIKAYRNDNLLGFDSKFRFSKLSKQIDAADASIQNNLTTVKLKYSITPPLNVPTRFDISLNAKIDKGDATNRISSLNSTAFMRDGLVSYIGDDGLGSLYIYRLVLSQKVIVELDIGTIDYDTGRIIIPSLVVQSIVDGSENIFLILKPGTNDLNPVRNQILLMLDEDISVEIEDEDA